MNMRLSLDLLHRYEIGQVRVADDLIVAPRILYHAEIKSVKLENPSTTAYHLEMTYRRVLEPAGGSANWPSSWKRCLSIFGYWAEIADLRCAEEKPSGMPIPLLLVRARLNGHLITFIPPEGSGWLDFDKLWGHKLQNGHH